MLQAEYSVNTAAVELSAVRVVSERLSLVGSGLELVAWTADKYGRPTSYSRLDQFANVVVVSVNPTGQ